MVPEYVPIHKNREYHAEHSLAQIPIGYTLVVCFRDTSVHIRDATPFLLARIATVPSTTPTYRGYTKNWKMRLLLRVSLRTKILRGLVLKTRVYGPEGGSVVIFPTETSKDVLSTKVPYFCVLLRVRPSCRAHSMYVRPWKSLFQGRTLKTVLLGIQKSY